jgi:UDPglucose--hexose-1-phosphate uridylyltransferase
VYRHSEQKLDGRWLHLYGRRPVQVASHAAGLERAGASPHLRWHPLRGEWISYAVHRQHRTFLPPAGFNPLRPSDANSEPTELPMGGYDIAVFENRFPALIATAAAPPSSIVPTAPAQGACEVVVFTQDERATLGSLPLDQVDLLFQVWAERYAALGSLDAVRYVMPFENRGVEVGVTLHHPHGQIYAYPFVPPVPERELSMQRGHFEQTGRNLLADLFSAELRDGRRVLYADDHAIAVVPAFARYPYEVWVAPLRPTPSLVDISAAERWSLARALKTVLLTYDAFWGSPFPYLMVMHQAPTDGGEHPEAHLHIELYPPYRMPGRLKYLAGTEIGAGMFANDSLPEEKAADLRTALVDIDR